jgi:homoserine O-succinyltransferase/O-acetyltransferase
MPVHMVGDTSRNSYSNVRFDESEARGLHIGLINNMPDGAMKATERQFRTLLGSAANGVVVHLSLFALPDVPRNESGRHHVRRFYSGIENLWDSRLDGLIVTGADPQTANLADEPYWGSLTKVIEWAEHNTRSTVWSCLAAHAAILHNDGIGRFRLSDKRFGVFECARTSDHQLNAGVPSLFRMPHSRWNDIPGNELADCGYHVLTRAKDGSVDAFVRQRKSLAVFFQGHPEYEVNSLLLEYRRDVGRYFSGERDTYPAMPEGYVDGEIADVFTRLQNRALSDRRKELLEDFPAALVEKRVANTWHPVAARVYRNWLAYLGVQKERLAVLT